MTEGINTFDLSIESTSLGSEVISLIDAYSYDGFRKQFNSYAVDGHDNWEDWKAQDSITLTSAEEVWDNSAGKEAVTRKFINDGTQMILEQVTIKGADGKIQKIDFYDHEENPDNEYSPLELPSNGDNIVNYDIWNGTLDPGGEPNWIDNEVWRTGEYTKPEIDIIEIINI